MSARAANAATPDGRRLDPGGDRRQRPHGRHPEGGCRGEPERRHRGRGAASTAPTARDPMTSVLAPPRPHAARPTAGDHGGASPRRTRGRGHEEVGHGGIPEQHRPLARRRGARGRTGSTPRRRRPPSARAGPDVGCEERGEPGGPDAGEDERAPEDERLRRPGPEDPAEHHAGRVARHGPGCRGAGAERERREPRVGRPGQVVGEDDTAAEGRPEDQQGDHRRGRAGTICRGPTSAPDGRSGSRPRARARTSSPRGGRWWP